MLHDLTNELTVLDEGLELLRNGVFCVITVLFTRRQVDVDTGAFAAEDFRAQALRAQVDGGSVDLVEQKSRQRAHNLQRKVGASNHVDRGNQRVQHDRSAAAVVDGD